MQISNLPRVLRSSKNPENVSLTVKSLAVLVIISLAKQAGFDVSEIDALKAVEVIITIGAGVGVLAGLVRKYKNSLDK